MIIDYILSLNACVYFINPFQNNHKKPELHVPRDISRTFKASLSLAQCQVKYYPDQEKATRC